MVSTQELQSLVDGGGTVVGRDGEKIGKVEQVFIDDQTSEPEWVTVKTGMFGGAASFVPLQDASVNGQEIQVPFGKDKVKDAPRIEDADGHLSREEESELYRYYGRDYDDATHTEPDYRHSGADIPAETDSRDSGTDTRAGTDARSMTRSEEQVDIGTEKVSTGKVRLRKYVVTENVTKTVPVTHEEVRVEREPISETDRGDHSAGGEIDDTGEDVAEVELSEDRIVVDKHTVPVEKVSMGTETVTEEQQVSEEVRKEQIDADETDAGTTGTHRSR